MAPVLPTVGPAPAPVSPDTIRTLAIEVVRARNVLSRAQIAASWLPSAAAMDALYRDEQLVQEADRRPDG